MDYKKLVFLKKLHALIGYVWDVPWDEEWPDAQNRRNSVDFYACVLYDVATVPKEEERGSGGLPNGNPPCEILIPRLEQRAPKGRPRDVLSLGELFLHPRDSTRNTGQEKPDA